MRPAWQSPVTRLVTDRRKTSRWAVESANNPRKKTGVFSRGNSLIGLLLITRRASNRQRAMPAHSLRTNLCELWGTVPQEKALFVHVRAYGPSKSGYGGAKKNSGKRVQHTFGLSDASPAGAKICHQPAKKSLLVYHLQTAETCHNPHNSV